MNTHQDPQSTSPRPVALVIGGTGGIGEAICRQLLTEGYRVVFTHRSDSDRAARLADDLGALGPVRTVRLDLSDLPSVEPTVVAVCAEEDRLDVLVHAAGPHVPMVHLSKVSAAQMVQQLTDDTGAFFAVVNAALPTLRNSKGNVVAVTSAATARYPVRDGLSSAPKAGVEALVRAFTAEEGRFGVRFNAVGPGMLTDGMAARLMANGDLDEAALEITRGNIPMRTFGSARDISEAVCFLASPRAGFISGQKLDVDGGYGV